MGCCISHSLDSSSPYPGGMGGGSTRAINDNVTANSPTSLGPARTSIADGLGGGGRHTPLDAPPRTAHTTLLSSSSTSRRICYNTAGNDPSHNTINALDPSPASTLTHASNSHVRAGDTVDSGGHRSSPRHHFSRRPLSQHINKPLRRHVWAGLDSEMRTEPQRRVRRSYLTPERAREEEQGEHARRPAWTRATLRQERRDFFDTRVTGREEAWQALRAAAQVLWEADEQWAAADQDRSHRPTTDMSHVDGRAGLPGREQTSRRGRRRRRRRRRGRRRRRNKVQSHTGAAEDEGGDAEADELEADEADDESNDGEPIEEENDPDPRPAALATAQTILDAADITLPTGDLAHGAYDSLGGYYPLPEYVACDPPNLVDAIVADTSDDSEAHASGVAAALVQERTLLGTPGGNDHVDPDETTAEEDGEFPHDNDDDDDDEDDDENSKLRARRREEKGKAVVDVRDLMPLRARLSDGSMDVVVSIGTGETARRIAAIVADEAKLPPNKQVRIVYLGKMLKGSLPLSAQGWRPGRVVNAFVFDR